MATIRNRNGKWHVQIRKTDSRALTKTFSLRSDAILWSREMERSIDLHGTVLVDRASLKITVGHLIDKYEEEVGQTKKSYSVEVYYLREFRRSELSKLLLSQITPQDIQKWVDDKSKTHKPASVARALGLLSHIFSTAISIWLFPLQYNPVTRVRLKSIQAPNIRRLSADVKNKLSQPSNMIGWIVLFALETAMRRGEILNLKWSDIDKNQRFAYLRDTKNGHARYVPLTDLAMEAIHHGARDNEHVFPMTANAVQLAWQRMKKISNIEGVRFHDLRHEAISRFFEMGLTVPEVASISGHRTVSMLFRYAHADIQTINNKLNL